MVDSLEGDIFSLTHILIAKSCKGIQVFIYRSFSDITPARVGDFKRSESREESREEEDADTDFLDLFSIEMLDRHLRAIERYRIAFPSDSHTEGLDDREEGDDIADLWDIVQSEVVEKKSCRDEGKC